MTKDQLHEALQNPPATITQDEVTAIYGDDKKQQKGGQSVGRMDILAKTYNLTVSFDSGVYEFS